MTRRRWLIGGGVVLLIVVAVLAFPYARFAYMIYRHGPPALERLPVAAPVATLRYGRAPEQWEELRLPAGTGPFPVAVTIHGGCWDAGVGGNARQMAPLADALTRAGFATLNIEYRQLGQAGGGWPGTFRDAGAAIDSVRPLARRYPLDLTRVVVVGHSAGALLALWSGARRDLTPASDLYAADPLRPAAVVAVDGPGALEEFIGEDAKICDKPVIVPVMGGTPARVPQHYRDASPQSHLPLGVPQYLSLAAFTDLMQPYAARAARSGDPVATYRATIPSHFRIINPTEPDGQGTIALILRAKARLEGKTR